MCRPVLDLGLINIIISLCSQVVSDSKNNEKNSLSNSIIVYYLCQRLPKMFKVRIILRLYYGQKFLCVVCVVLYEYHNTLVVV